MKRRNATMIRLYNPWLAAGIAVACAGTIVGIYYLGKKEHKW